VFSLLATPSFDAKLLDFHYRIFPDSFPTVVTYQRTIDVPRNYTLGLQLAIKGSLTQSYTISLENVKHNNGNSYSFNFTARPLMKITVEGNTQGSGINVPHGSYPTSWRSFFIRDASNASFDLLEAVAVANAQNSITAVANTTAGALIQIKIESDCPVGTYTGKIVVSKSVSDKVELPISFIVHNAIVSRENFLDCNHWLSADPVDLRINGTQVAWWSEEHWQLLKRAGQLLYEDGNNMMFTPLVNTANPLIQAKYVNGELQFDYTQFDRWVSLFDSIGFKNFDGFHLRNMASDLTVLDISDDQKKSIESLGMNIGCFQDVFLRNLNEHLTLLGIHDRFIMHLYDEPAAEKIDEYIHYKNILTRCMPGIKCIDATNGSGAPLFTNLVDYQICSIYGIKDSTIETRLQEGRPAWLYNVNSPFPPYPNRHLDLQLTENRLWPLLALKYKASGYLFWAVNTYRGVSDEYASSLGALPSGLQGFPPGECWFYYRTSDGLIPSLRMMSFREGMIDVSLLKQLAKTRPDQIAIQLAKILPGAYGDDILGYKTDFDTYNNNRKEVLELLDLPNIQANYSTRIFTQNVGITPFNSVINSRGDIPSEQTYSQVTTTTFMPPTQTAVEGKDDGSIATAKFSQPQGLAKDAAGNIYVTEKTGNRIRKINFSTGQVTTIAGDISAINGLTGQTNANGTAARFNQPTDVVVDSQGNLFVTDMNNHGIRKITPAGDVTLFAGPVVRATGMTDATGSTARFNQPWGITIDSNDNLYVVDRVNNRIRKITPNAVVTTFAGTGTAGSADGAATAATFNNPTGIEIDSNGDFYIADGGGNRLRKITTLTMTVSTIAGNDTGGTTDGQGTSATFSLPSGVAVDEYGVVYVSDKGYSTFLGNKIRRVSTGGFVMTLAGSVAGITNDVVGTTAKFRNPSDLLYDKTNRCLYVADCVNHTIRRINLTGYNVTPVLPVGLTLNMLSGEISGTPTAITAAADYTIAGFNTIGASSATMNITVADPAITIYTITSTAGANGEITGSKEVLSGGSATFTITPSTGYEIDVLKVNGITITPTLNYAFENVTNNANIDVTFK